MTRAKNVADQRFWLLTDESDTPVNFHITGTDQEAGAFIAANDLHVALAASHMFGRNLRPYSSVEFVDELVSSFIATATPDVVMLTERTISDSATRPPAISIPSLMADRAFCDFALSCPPEKFLMVNDGQHAINPMSRIDPVAAARRKMCELLVPRLEAAIRILEEACRAA